MRSSLPGPVSARADADRRPPCNAATQAGYRCAAVAMSGRGTATSFDGVATAHVHTPPSDAPQPGAQVGRYLAIAELGRGAMGVVLRAYDPRLQREVAIKVLATDALPDEARARLVREARAMAKLAHPNVVAVYDVESDDDDVVLAMQYVPGTTLREWLRAGERTWATIVEAFVAAGRGLAA